MRQNGRTIFPVLYWTLLILCFFIFPAFLLNLAVSRYFTLAQHDLESQGLLKAQKVLARLRWQSDGTRFFHQLFSNVLAKPCLTGVPASELAQRINRLKTAFPEELGFIVWDDKGKLNEELSDDQGFITVKNSLNAYLKELQQIAVTSFPQNPSLSTEIKKRARKFRQFLGPFISSAKLAESFVPNNKSGCFQMHADGRQAYGWYSAQPEFSVLVYISKELIHSMIQPRAFCQKNARTKSSTAFFLIDEKTLEIFPETSPENARQLAINLRKTDSFTPPELLKSGRSFYTFQKLTADWWAAAVIDSGQRPDAQIQNNKVMFRLLAAMFLSYFVLRCYFLVHSNPFSSIRWKLFVIFLYTVAIPLMIFSTVGFEHLAQMEKGIESRRGIELVQLLGKVDHQFSVHLQQMAAMLSDYTDLAFWNTSASRPVPQDPVYFADQMMQKFSPHSVIIMDERGDNLLPRKYSGKMTQHSIIKALAIDLLEFLNEREHAQCKPVKLVTESLILAYAHSHKAIRIFNMADTTEYYYMQTVRNPMNGRYEYCIQMFWDFTEMQREFFRQFCQQLKGDHQLLPVIFFPGNNLTFPDSAFRADLNEFFERVDLRGLQLERYADLSGKRFLVAGIRGQNLLKAVVAALLNFDLIEDEVGQYKAVFAGLFLLTLLFTVALYNLLNYQILNPVNQLIAGVEKVRAGDYAYRVSLKADNELGSLGNSINNTMENLQELAIARTVQEALLPESTPAIAGFEIYAKTRPMTKLGGDYYDFFVNHEGRLLAMIADVAGHGVQAALIMAMAKSVMLLARNEEAISEQIMERLNATFCSLRKSSIKTMLTGQMLTFLPAKNSCELVNAGHCAPLIISADGKEVKAVGGKSFPLGYGVNRKFNSEAIELAPGSTLLLYTDGILECIDSSGQMLGPKGFVELVRASYCSDLATFYDNMFARYEKWRVSQDDDITFVLIRRTSDEK
ncbi:MAG: hypothetical protein A2W80_14270 [Candidatus Riflebacteria bacterium GWC2_50_8]|nr:MAG: hypothetical protein A2W80_14270 [Candidatus Riflebacteria bacterium GWC2_50_8]